VTEYIHSLGFGDRMEDVILIPIKGVIVSNGIYLAYFADVKGPMRPLNNIMDFMQEPHKWLGISDNSSDTQPDH
jgi:hypothetical protein